VGVEIYIKTLTYNRDVRRLVYQTKFVSCTQTHFHLPDDGWVGRMLDADSARVMDAAARLPAQVANSIRIVDVSRLAGRVRAWRAGVKQIPAVISDGQIYNGVSQSRKALDVLAQTI
jgi:hypothetical protein